LKSVIKCGQHSHDLIKYLAFITKKKAIKITKETFGSAINGENTVRASDGHYQKSAHSLAARKVHIRKSCELLHLYVCVCVCVDAANSGAQVTGTCQQLHKIRLIKQTNRGPRVPAALTARGGSKSIQNRHL